MPDRLVDVHAGNGTINWATVRLAGFTGAIIRCCVDDEAADVFFQYNWTRAREEGLSRIAYLYGKPSDGAKQQADHALAILESDLQPNDGLALELRDGRSANLPAFVTRIAQQWAWEYPDNRRLLFSSVEFIRDRLDTPEVADWFDLWVDSSHPRTAWDNWRIWRTTATGRVPGISGHVGINLADGIADYLGGPNEVRVSPLNPSPVVGPQGGQWIAQHGDTMWSIAMACGVSPTALLETNPQLTTSPYVGEIVYLPGSIASTKPANADVYIAQPGDTLGSVSQKYGRTAKAMASANPRGDRLHVGQPVWIPPNPTYSNPNPRCLPPVPVKRTIRVMGQKINREVYPGQFVELSS